MIWLRKADFQSISENKYARDEENKKNKKQTK
jgi:hypothetical protein